MLKEISNKYKLNPEEKFSLVLSNTDELTINYLFDIVYGWHRCWSKICEIDKVLTQ